MNHPHLTTAELAQRWQRPESWIREQAKASAIPAIRIGDRWRFPVADIEAWELARKTRDPYSTTDLAAKRRGWRK